MTRAYLRDGERPAFFVGSSYKDLQALPEPVRRAMSVAIGVAQLGGKHPNAKPWRGLGSGVLEVVQD